MIEIILGVIQNLQIFGFLLLVFLSVAFIFFLSSCWENDRNKVEDLKKWIKTIPIFLILIIFVSIPSVEDLWKIRISLIKLSLASPDNIKKGTDEIIKIAHELECKYLICEKDEKK